jgi:hypothetical protein
MKFGIFEDWLLSFHVSTQLQPLNLCTLPPPEETPNVLPAVRTMFLPWPLLEASTAINNARRFVRWVRLNTDVSRVA